jgi:phage shock protein PspC (stress-responsive transcriptional regulator)
MKKNFSVNIGKRLFNIDEDAYECLNSYLSRLRGYFSTEEGRDEILADIEMRIAELLELKVEAKGQGIIILDYIQEVIKEMGEPGQLSDNEEIRPKDTTQQRTTGKLFRDPVNRKVGGVAAGLSAFFGIDPVWFRLIFVFSTLLYGSGPVIYIILWLILPEAQTTSEKLEMQRQSVNIGTLRNELASAGKGIQKTGSSFFGSLGSFLRNVFEIAARLIRWFFQLFGRLTGLLMLFLVLLFYVGIGLALLVRDHVGMGGYQFDSVTQYQVFQWMVPGTSDRWLFYVAFLLVLVAISGLLIYGGLRLLLKWPPLRWPVAIAFVLILFAGFLTAGTAIYRYSRTTDVSDSVSQYNSIIMPSGKLYIQSGPWDFEKFLNPLSGNIGKNTDSEVLGEINLSFRPAPGDSLILTLIRSASSTSRSRSVEFASNIKYSWDISDTLLLINPYYLMPYDDGMHYQELNVIVGIPVNKKIYLDPAISWKVRYSDFKDSNSDGGDYLMTTSGLVRKMEEIQSADSTALLK